MFPNVVSNNLEEEYTKFIVLTVKQETYLKTQRFKLQTLRLSHLGNHPELQKIFVAPLTLVWEELVEGLWNDVDPGFDFDIAEKANNVLGWLPMGKQR